MTSTKSAAGAGAALGAVLLWATNAFAATIALDRLTVLQLLAVQYASAALVVALWRFGSQTWHRGRTAPHESRTHLSMHAVGAGVLGLTGTIFLQYWAFATAPIVGANVISYTWPLIAALWVAATVRTRQTTVGVPLAVLGFLGVASIFLDHEAVGGGAAIGYVIAVGSATCMAFYTVAAGRIVASVADVLLPATIVGALLAMAGALLQGMPWPPGAQWWPAIYIGLGPMAAGCGLWTYAMADRRAERLSPIGYLTPLLSTILLLVAGQPFTTSTLAGAALILVCSAGVLINERIAQQGRRRAAAARTDTTVHPNKPSKGRAEGVAGPGCCVQPARSASASRGSCRRSC